MSSFGPNNDRLGMFLTNSFGDVTSSRMRRLEIAAARAASKPRTNGDWPLALTADIKPPSKLDEISPIYPASAQRDVVQGRVILPFVVGGDGTVTDGKAVCSLARLHRAAIDCVNQWKYAPAVRAGKPVTADVTVTVNFRLTEPNSDEN